MPTKLSLNSKITKCLKHYLDRLHKARQALSCSDYEAFEEYFRLCQAAIANLNVVLNLGKINQVSLQRNIQLRDLYDRIEEERNKLTSEINASFTKLQRELVETRDLKVKLTKFRSTSSSFSKFEFGV